MLRTILHIITLLLVVTPARSSAQQLSADRQLREVIVMGASIVYNF